MWGEYGFKDAFNLDRRWIASSYIAIDQGPIVIMMENYRTGLLWDLFMKNSDILTGLSRLGFTVSGQSAVLRRESGKIPQKFFMAVTVGPTGSWGVRIRRKKI